MLKKYKNKNKIFLTIPNFWNIFQKLERYKLGTVNASRLAFYFKKTFIFYLINVGRSTVVIKIKIKLKKIT